MRLVYLMPGAGGTFYCENCMRDAGLIRALTDMGHQPLMVPLYLPLQIDDRGGLRESPIFFGGINVYLQQKSALFRKTPRWVDRLLDSPRLLRWAASKAGMTQARDLAATMLSMLQGEDGRQAKELDRLIAWLATEEKPDCSARRGASAATWGRPWSAPSRTRISSSIPSPTRSVSRCGTPSRSGPETWMPSWP